MIYTSKQLPLLMSVRLRLYPFPTSHFLEHIVRSATPWRPRQTAHAQRSRRIAANSSKLPEPGAPKAWERGPQATLCPAANLASRSAVADPGGDVSETSSLSETSRLRRAADVRRAATRRPLGPPQRRTSASRRPGPTRTITRAKAQLRASVLSGSDCRRERLGRPLNYGYEPKHKRAGPSPAAATRSTAAGCRKTWSNASIAGAASTSRARKRSAAS